LGGLGIITRITIDVLPRPYLTTVQGRTDRYLLQDRQAFIDKFKTLTAELDRIEVFYSPYAAAPNLPFVPLPNFLVLGWKTVADPDPKLENSAADPTTACVLAGKGEFGAPFLGGLAEYAKGARSRWPLLQCLPEKAPRGVRRLKGENSRWEALSQRRQMARAAEVAAGFTVKLLLADEGKALQILACCATDSRRTTRTIRSARSSPLSASCAGSSMVLIRQSLRGRLPHITPALRAHSCLPVRI
jgi:hypothetical protein